MAPDSTTGSIPPGEGASPTDMAPRPSAALAGLGSGVLPDSSSSGSPGSIANDPGNSSSSSGSAGGDVASGNSGSSADAGNGSRSSGTAGSIDNSGLSSGAGNGSSGGGGGVSIGSAAGGSDGGTLGSSFAAGPGAAAASGASPQQVRLPPANVLPAALVAWLPFQGGNLCTLYQEPLYLEAARVESGWCLLVVI